MKTNYLPEAKRLLPLINEKTITKKEDYLFFKSMETRVRLEGFVSKDQIFWLRDIKDRYLESESNGDETRDTA